MQEANKSLLTRLVFDAAVAIKTREINKYFLNIIRFNLA
jgi:hypothetical protein